MSNPQPQVFMGGTFDPIHHGHLRAALEVQQWLGVDRVALVPARRPVHRESPGCSAAQRLEMARLAVADEPGLTVDAREVESAAPSYSLLTLQALRAELGPEVPLCMVVGMDSYLGLPSWHQWQQFPQLCHILVLMRPGYQFAPADELREFTDRHRTEHKHDLLQRPAGCVLLHEQTPLAISATQVRDLITGGQSPRFLVPEAVWHYIQNNGLYGYSQQR